jgi:large subunit ribosomal protein L24
MAQHIRRGDEVVVIAGEHKGERGKVLRIDPKGSLVVIEGVNMVYRHVRPSRRNPQGGRIQKEAPIHISNVLPYDAAADNTYKGARTRFEVQRDANRRVTSKRRVTVNGTVLGEVSKASKQ